MKKPSFKRNTDLRFTTERGEKKQRIKLFIAAAVIFAVAFAGISSYILFKNYDFNIHSFIRGPGSAEEERRPVEEVTPELPEFTGGVNILVAGINENNVEYAAVVRMNVSQAQIYICPISAETQATVSGKTATLSGHYAYGGSAQLKAAAAAAGGIKIDRYICITQKGLRELSKALGGIVLEMPSPIAYVGEDFSLNLRQGRQTVSGDTLYKLMLYSAGGESAKMANQGLAISCVIDCMLTLDNLLEGEKFFYSVINCVDSDISASDFSASERVLEYFVKTEERKSNTVVYKLDEFKD